MHRGRLTRTKVLRAGLHYQASCCVPGPRSTQNSRDICWRETDHSTIQDEDEAASVGRVLARDWAELASSMVRARVSAQELSMLSGCRLQLSRWTASLISYRDLYSKLPSTTRSCCHPSFSPPPLPPNTCPHPLPSHCTKHSAAHLLKSHYLTTSPGARSLQRLPITYSTRNATESPARFMRTQLPGPCPCGV